MSMSEMWLLIVAYYNKIAIIVETNSLIFAFSSSLPRVFVSCIYKTSEKKNTFELARLGFQILLR